MRLVPETHRGIGAADGLQLKDLSVKLDWTWWEATFPHQHQPWALKHNESNRKRINTYVSIYVCTVYSVFIHTVYTEEGRDWANAAGGAADHCEQTTRTQYKSASLSVPSISEERGY